MFGIRAVAIFEAAKAALVLVVGFGLLSLINRDAEAFAVYLVKHLHLNPASKYPHVFIDAASRVTNAQLWLFASLAMVDAGIRSIEAIGLWRERKWAEWLGMATAAIYLPFEVYELSIHVTWLKSATFVANIVIILFLGHALYSAKRSASPMGPSSSP